MHRLRIVFVSAYLCALSIGITETSSLQFRPNAHTVGSSSSENSFKPAILKFDLSKKGVFVGSCYGADMFSPQKSTKKYWLLPADCLDKTKYDTLTVKYGYRDNSMAKLNLNKDLFYEIHPAYDAATKANNIALVRLPSYLHLELRQDFKSIELPSTSDTFSDSSILEMYEYSSTTNPIDSNGSASLLGVMTKRISSIWCKITYPLSPLKNNHICASGLFNKGLLQDDYGTPLVTRDGENFNLLGLATIIRPWANKFSFPMEFMSVQPYLDWINARIKVKSY